MCGSVCDIWFVNNMHRSATADNVPHILECPARFRTLTVPTGSVPGRCVCKQSFHTYFGMACTVQHIIDRVIPFQTYKLVQEN